ncbi:MAG: hypothetical protein COB41_00520 [Proteobacteria bacterium]|nr:MAG: hypothetical protein COB41_00520 [Pseudomonadota bacterium]
MPYIKKDRRNDIVRCDSYYRELIPLENINNSGELQYAMAMLFKFYMKKKGLNYQACNDIMGALAGAQMEFYRRVVAPYEDLKIKENGDV